MSHVFKDKLGRSFYKYLTECRIITAQVKILGGEPLKQICHDCGFQDYSNFYRAFVQAVGVSPNEFRRSGIPDHFFAERHAYFSFEKNAPSGDTGSQNA